MDMPKDPYTMPSGLTFVQTELWEGDRLKMKIQRMPPGEGHTLREPMAIIGGVNLEKEDDESEGEFLALLMIAQHPSLHKPNTPERVVTEHVNRLLRHQYLRLSMEVDDKDENIDTYQEIISMLQEVGLHPRERDDGTVDGCDLLDKIGHLIKLANLPDPLPAIPPSPELGHIPADEPTLSDRVAYLEGRLEYLEAMALLPGVLPPEQGETPT